MLFNLIMLAVPVVFLCASAILAVKAFEHGKNRKKTVAYSDFAHSLLYLHSAWYALSSASAATGDAAAATSGMADGLAYIGAALCNRSFMCRRRYCRW